MPRFLATDHRADGDYGVTIETADQADAIRQCKDKGWTYEGEIYAQFDPAPDSPLGSPSDWLHPSLRN